MGGFSGEVKARDVILVAGLSLTLNNLVTPLAIISMVSLESFIEKPVYYIYAYGPFFWSIYHALLALMVYWFFKVEGESISDVVSSFRDKTFLSIMIVAVLTGLSVLFFQFLEPLTMDLMFGSGSMLQVINEYKRVPLSLALYGILVTSLTAGICEELVWRGYLQTRLQSWFSPGVAITIQAILFGFWHGVSIHAVFTAIFGFIFGFTYMKTQRLSPIMVSHWLGDVIGFSAMYFH